jgi:hypothetical protein
MSQSNQSEAGAIQLDGATATLVASTETLSSLAYRLVMSRVSTGGDAELSRLATFGWPHDAALPGDSLELRYAIQDEAKELEASL